MNRRTQSVGSFRLAATSIGIRSTPMFKDLKMSRMKGIIPTSTRRKKRRVARSIHIIEPVQTKNLKNKVVLESDLDQLKLGEKKSQFFSKRLSSRRIEENSDGMINAISSLSIKNLVSGNSLNTNRWLKRSNNHNEIQ